jgi:hypothetical protein
MALVSYKAKNVLGIGMAGGEFIRLMPGINEVSDLDLNCIKNHPLFKARVDNGSVQIMYEKIDKDGKTSADDLLKNIPNMFDKKLLRKIIDTDERKSVVKAATEQLEKILNPLKSKEAKNDDHFG